MNNVLLSANFLDQRTGGQVLSWSVAHYASVAAANSAKQWIGPTGDISEQ